MIGFILAWTVSFFLGMAFGWWYRGDSHYLSLIHI